MAETWRVVLASGEVREVCVEPHDSDWSDSREVRYFARWAKRFAGGDTPRDAIVRLASDRRGVDGWPVAEILAPGEATRAELVAQLAAVTAERDRALGVVDSLITQANEVNAHRRAERAAEAVEIDALHGLIAKQGDILTAVANALKGPPPELMRHSHHDLGAVAAATVAQQAPLVACVDALRAAARDAGWRDAGATGAELVAWVRRGEREACAARCDAVAKGADNALPGREGDQRAYLKGRRRGAEVCAEALREGGE